MSKLFTSIFLVSSLLLCIQTSAQLKRKFTPRFSVDLKGNLVQVSNNIITTKKGSGQAPAYTRVPPNCGASDSLCKNDGQPNTNIDIDSDPTTFNSSSATLTLPACSAIEFAGVYWGAGIAIGQQNNGTDPMKMPGLNEIKFKAPGGVYETVIANIVDTIKSVFDGYQGFADVTSIVKAGGAGSYTVANVKCDTINPSLQAINNAYGGWTMVVIYRDSTQPVRNLTVFDGIAVVGQTSPAVSSVQFTAKGFKCPPTGGVTAKIGVVTYDGDRAAVDGFEVKQSTTSTFVDQTGVNESAATYSGSSDAWNSSITDTSTLVTSRNPAHQNTYGYDAHVYKLNNGGKQYLKNNDDSLTFRVKTTSEGYVVGLVTTQIDTYEPELLLVNSLADDNGGTIEKGDYITVQSTIRNAGNDAATGVKVQNTLPAYFDYVPNSLTIDGVSQSDGSADDRAEYNATTKKIVAYVGSGSAAGTGGNVLASNTTYLLSYKMSVTNDCSSIGATPTSLLQQSKIFYTGVASATADSSLSRPISPNECIKATAPDTVFLNIGCSVLPVTLLDFSVATVNNANVVKWKTEEHMDGKSYTVESSSDGVQFKSVSVLNIPLSMGVKNYTHVDYTPYSTPKIYYRLLITNIDGKKEYSKIVMIDNRLSSGSITMNPVPVISEVRFTSSEKMDRIEWYNNAGARIYSVKNVASGQAINVSHFASGLYVVKIYTPTGMKALKMIKN